MVAVVAGAAKEGGPLFGKQGFEQTTAHAKVQRLRWCRKGARCDGLLYSFKNTLKPKEGTGARKT